MRLVTPALASALLGSALVPPGLAHAGARVSAQVLPAWFTGEFGSDIETDILYVPLVFGIDSERQSFRATFPYVWIRTEEPVTFVGGDIIRRGPIVVPGPAPMPAGGGETTDSGPGDVVLKEEFFFLKGDGVKRPWLSGIARVKLPTADEEKGLGTGETDYGPGVGLIQPIGSRLGFVAEALYVVRGDPEDFDLENTWWTSAGLQVRPTGAASIHLIYERRQSVIDGREAIEDLMLGWDQKVTGNVTFRSGLFYGLSDTAEDWGAMLGFTSSRRAP